MPAGLCNLSDWQLTHIEGLRGVFLIVWFCLN
jgi:hypothetical protein